MGDPWSIVDSTIKDVNAARSLTSGNITSLSDAKEKLQRVNNLRKNTQKVAGKVADSGVLDNVDVHKLEKQTGVFGLGTVLDNARGESLKKRELKQQAKDEAEKKQQPVEKQNKEVAAVVAAAVTVPVVAPVVQHEEPEVVEVGGFTGYDDNASGLEEHGVTNSFKSAGFGSSQFDNDDDLDDEDEGYGASRRDIDSFYKANTLADSKDDDELLNRIRMQTASLHIDEGSSGLYQDSGNFITTSALLDEEFNFNKLIKNQYLIFSDYDISDILDFVFSLRAKYSHTVTYPAAVIFQCVRYADHIKDNDILVETFLNLTFTKIRSNITSSMSGITNVLKDGDIVLQSYWVSVVNFLFYYLCKDEGFFVRYPKVLQELITTLDSLILELTNCLKFRMGLIIDDCLLNYANIPDLSETLYKSDWNFFKKKHVKHSTFDDIYQMLYPPSVKQQLKPSPIKIVQTLGALLYVLDIHKVHPLLKQQCFTIVFQWLSYTIFNRIISNKKHLSRKKAIQIRLNLSSLEDWARSNNQAPKMPDIDLDIYKKFPYNLTEGDHAVVGHFTPRFAIQTCLFYNGDSSHPADLQFYHNSLFDIFRYFFEPLYQLLQFLQCLTALQTEEELHALLPNLNKLNDIQLLQVLSKYRYEVDEEKVSKEIKSAITTLTKTRDQSIKRVPYLDKKLIHLNPDYGYAVALATLSELIDEYGSGIGGIHRERAAQFEPFLPYEIIDAIDEIHEQTTEKINTQRYGDDNDEDEDDDDEDEEDNDDSTENDFNDKNKDDGLFKELEIPRSLVHKPWGDDENEVNPW